MARDPKTGRFPKGSGIPARGAGRGDGWGGPAKGASTAPRLARAGDPTSDAIRAKGNDATVRANAAERAARLIDHLEHLAFNAAREETQLSAAVAALNRVEGMPVQRNVNVNTDDLSRLTDAELDAELARLADALRQADAGSAPPEGQDGPDGVVH